MDNKNKKIKKISLQLIELCEQDIFNKETARVKNLLFKQKTDDFVFSKILSINFLALAAIYQYSPNQITSKDLVRMLNILTNCEVSVGGPYKNPISHRVETEDNIVIAYFLSLLNVNLPNLDRLIEKNLNKIQSKPNSLNYKLLKKFYHKKTISKINNEDQTAIKKIIIKIKQRANSLSPHLRRIVISEIEKTLKKNKDKQMSLMAYYFKLALGENGAMISDDFVTEAGLANIFYWTAFIIYDDFWDEDDKAIPRILPAANLYARHYTDFYSKDPEFRVFFHNLMDKLDAANTWETIYCRTKVINSKFIIPDRLPEYGNYDLKFYPASGQILGPMAMLVKAGYDLESQEATDLTNYFRNYLIAMQINDDAHDYIEDMERGHLSTVVVMLLKDWKIKYPESKEIDLVADLKKLQELFWFKTIKTACELAVDYTTKSREALDKLHFLKNPTPLAHFIDIAENVAKNALEEQRKSLDFLKEFK